MLAESGECQPPQFIVIGCGMVEMAKWGVVVIDPCAHGIWILTRTIELSIFAPSLHAGRKQQW